MSETSSKCSKTNRDWNDLLHSSIYLFLYLLREPRKTKRKLSPRGSIAERFTSLSGKAGDVWTLLIIVKGSGTAKICHLQLLIFFSSVSWKTPKKAKNDPTKIVTLFTRPRNTQQNLLLEAPEQKGSLLCLWRQEVSGVSCEPRKMNRPVTFIYWSFFLSP